MADWLTRIGPPRWPNREHRYVVYWYTSGRSGEPVGLHAMARSLHGVALSGVLQGAFGEGAGNEDERGYRLKTEVGKP